MHQFKTFLTFLALERIDFFFLSFSATYYTTNYTKSAQGVHSEERERRDRTAVPYIIEYGTVAD